MQSIYILKSVTTFSEKTLIEQETKFGAMNAQNHPLVFQTIAKMSLLGIDIKK